MFLDSRPTGSPGFVDHLGLVDTHAHLGLFEDPSAVMARARAARVQVLTVTNRPSEYRALRLANPALGDRLALGLHPECAGSTYEAHELRIFERELASSTWIGEIGLDGHIADRVSPNFGSVASMADQERMLDEILRLDIGTRPMTVHSQGAELRLLGRLVEKGVEHAVFHWFVGNRASARRVIEAGYLLSVNPAMAASDTGRSLIRWLPIDALLLETDGPFTTWTGRPSEPADLSSLALLVAELRHDEPGALLGALVDNYERLEGGVSGSMPSQAP